MSFRVNEMTHNLSTQRLISQQSEQVSLLFVAYILCHPYGGELNHIQSCLAKNSRNCNLKYGKRDSNRKSKIISNAIKVQNNQMGKNITNLKL